MPLQLRRGNEADRSGVTPAAGEPLWIEDTETLYIGDGSTAGGIPVGGASSPLTTKGDIYVHSSGDTRLPVGTDGHILTADSTQATGMKWAAASGGAGGLANPLTADLDADGYALEDVTVVGNRDVPYDLSTDSDGLITTGTATLVSTKNAYYYADVATALTIKLPTVPAGEAPYGMVSISLDTGGSIALDTTPAYIWEKADPADADPTMPSTVGDAFCIYFRYDYVAGKYVLNLTFLESGTPAGAAVAYVSSSGTRSSLSAANRDTHMYTYNYTSTTQDGTVYAIVGFVVDATGSQSIVPDGALTEIVTFSGVAGSNQWWGYYKPSQADLDGGTLDLSFGMTNEMGQFFVFEISGGDTSNPKGATNTDTSGTNRTSVGPVSITSTVADSLLVACVSTDDGNATTLSVTDANGWTQLLVYNSASYMPNFAVHILAAPTVTSYDSPTWANTGSSEFQAVVFELVP